MSRRALPDGGDAGFTLVEVLVAFFIAALTLTAALRVLGEGAQWARRGPAAALRMEEAASVLDSLAADPALRSGERDGTFTDGQPWRARVTDVTALAAAGAPGRLLRLDLYAGSNLDAPLLVTLASAARPAR
ncbi:MAG: prepilin-type N-terminal cleavage/methylation domain-containing protein [Caulobacteraceae bacterium]|nr:prepilin-type N-terminal cleavage/methylation domain-containing protein [Caulobacter sp.]